MPRRNANARRPGYLPPSRPAPASRDDGSLSEHRLAGYANDLVRRGLAPYIIIGHARPAAGRPDGKTP